MSIELINERKREIVGRFGPWTAHNIQLEGEIYTIGKKIAGDDSCHSECPHCNRAYHRHCWEQTIQSFGKCGFCLR